MKKVKYRLKKVDSMNWAVIKTGKVKRKGEKVKVEDRIGYFPTLGKAVSFMLEFLIREGTKESAELSDILYAVESASVKTRKAVRLTGIE